MTAKIFSAQELVGYVDLLIGDITMGHLYGEFEPTKEYCNILHIIYKACSLPYEHIIYKACSLPYEAGNCEALKLVVQLSNGHYVYAAGGVTINDTQDLVNPKKQINIFGVDHYVIEDFLLNDRPFVEEPWEIISVAQKTQLEEELLKELKRESVKSSNKVDSFFGSKAVALCRNSSNERALFRIVSKNTAYDFAVVSLPAKYNQSVFYIYETEVFKSFDEFKYLRMYPDKAEWEY